MLNNALSITQSSLINYSFTLALSISLLLLPSPASADLLISPQRAMLDAKTSNVTIHLNNPGSVTRSYRLEWVERQLREDGTLEILESGSNPRSIANMVRFSPRQVTVPAGKTQTIRLDYRPPAGLAPGEYRSHLLIRQESPETSAQSEGREEGITFQIEALMSFTLPIFVRHGEGNSAAQITGVQPTTVERNGMKEPALNVTLTRDGNFSTYGQLVVYQQMQANSPVEEIGKAGGVAIYTEVNKQQRVISLKPGTQLTPGSWIRISYEGEGSDRGRTFSESVFQIAK